MSIFRICDREVGIGLDRQTQRDGVQATTNTEQRSEVDWKSPKRLLRHQPRDLKRPKQRKAEDRRTKGVIGVVAPKLLGEDV